MAVLLLAWAVPAFAAPITVTASWDANSEPNIAGYKLSYGTQTGVYTTTLDVGNVTSWPLSLNPGQYYFAVQAYDTNAQTSSYSVEVPFLLTSGSAPVIANLTPTSGPAGTPVVIAGSGFGASQGTSSVSFNGTSASPTAWSDTSITAPVPGGATTGSVTVTVGGLASNGAAFTVVPTPGITSLSPTSGAVSASVTITGTNFGATQGASTVKFNGVTATPTSWSATSIVTTVPATATTGSVKVTVGGVASNGVTFTVVPTASITSLSPTSGAVGASVTITGTNFGASQGASTVKFNGITATPTSWSATSIATPVPNGATTGSVKVTVGGVASNGVTFTVTSSTPSISSLSPTSGPVGASVTITGVNFGASQGASTVKFNGVTAAPTAWSATSVTAPVPAGATTGNVTVTVASVASNGVTFTVTTVPAPSITAMSATSGVVGTAITIMGTNFGATQGTSTVKFNGAAASPTAWSATSITAPVPVGATTGNVVVTAGGLASNGAGFTVTVPILPTMAVDRPSLNFGAVNTGSAFAFKTPAQTVYIEQTGAQSTVTWTAASNSPWLTVSPASGSGPAALAIGVQYHQSVPPAGSTSQTGAVTITYTGSSTPASTVSVLLNLPAASTAPVGLIDTPAAGASGLQGSIAMTGWSVDDIVVDRVELWRDLQPGEPTPPFAGGPTDPRNGKVFIGNATFVNDARSDIQALFPTSPLNYRGGWGYLLLTWGLWNQGNGSYTLYAVAFDAEGKATSLGQKTIGVANASANKPFGSIDTPAIGGTASGVTVNFGWGLTPNSGGTSCKVPSSGVQVSIDSGPLQPVVYGDVRTDIAGAFAGFTNSAAAGGHFTFDTSTLANGVHTIGWVITDDCNRADGVGSRFFTVQNTGVTSAPSIRAASTAALPDRGDPIVVARGFGELGATLDADETGVRTIAVKHGERIEVRLPHGYDQAWQVISGARHELPVGAHWDPASHTFAWEPAPGFLGTYEIVFVDGSATITILVSVS